jgi:hypothetical protein
MKSTKNKIVSSVSLHLDTGLYKQINQRDYLKLVGTLDDNLYEFLHNQLCLEIHNKLLFNRENSIYLNFEAF